MFDLPTDTAKQRRDYTRFVKSLKKKGFIMFQESIYMKLSINDSAVEALEKSVKSNLPPDGFVAILTITEKQFNSMNILLGEFISDTINNDDKVVEL